MNKEMLHTRTWPECTKDVQGDEKCLRQLEGLDESIVVYP